MVFPQGRKVSMSGRRVIKDSLGTMIRCGRFRIHKYCFSSSFDDETDQNMYLKKKAST